MKKTILAVALLVAGLAFADKEKSKEEFYEALQQNQFDVCAVKILECTSFYEEKRDKDDVEIPAMCRQMWEKWMTTDCTMTDESFMVMIRDINLDCDVVNATLARKDLTSTKKEHLIYDVSVWKIVKGSERFDICRDHLLDKSVSSNCYPLAIKYRFAAQYFDDKISLIEYDRSYFKTEEHRFAQFFFSQTEKQTYKQHPLFKTLADRYLLICQKDEEDFVKIVETLDEAFDTLDNRKKWCNSSWLSFNWKFRLAKGTGDFDLIMKPVQENIDKLDARQLDDIVMLVNSYEDDFRKQEIDQLLSELLRLYGNRKSESDEWKKAVEKLEGTIEIRKE